MFSGKKGGKWGSECKQDKVCKGHIHDKEVTTRRILCYPDIQNLWEFYSMFCILCASFPSQMRTVRPESEALTIPRPPSQILIKSDFSY